MSELFSLKDKKYCPIWRHRGFRGFYCNVSTEESVIQGIEIVATNFCESPYFKVLLDKIRTHPGQSEFKDQFISTAVEWGKAKYVETKSAEQAIKYAMLYIAYIIAENDLAVLNAKAHPNEGVGDASLDGRIPRRHYKWCL